MTSTYNPDTPYLYRFYPAFSTFLMMLIDIIEATCQHMYMNKVVTHPSWKPLLNSITEKYILSFWVTFMTIFLLAAQLGHCAHQIFFALEGREN